MKAVILAAGLGSRIHSATGGLPKCLLRFGERTILDFQIDSLLDAGIGKIALVVGYGREQIVDHVARLPQEKRSHIIFIANTDFAVTNNIYSLWLARSWVGAGDFVCMNADVLYHPQIILPALQTSSDISVIIDREFREETMKVIIEDGRVLVMKKGIPRERSSGTYIGITTFSHKICPALFTTVQSLLDEGFVNVFFNVAVERLIARGTRVGFTETAGLPWAEVDDPSDLQFARAEVYPRLAADIAASTLAAA